MANRGRQHAGQTANCFYHDQDSLPGGRQNPADDSAVHGQAEVHPCRRQHRRDSGAARSVAADEVDARRRDSAELREVPALTARGKPLAAWEIVAIVGMVAIAAMVAIAGCTPEKALDFGPVGEISTPPTDQLSR